MRKAYLDLFEASPATAPFGSFPFGTFSCCGEIKSKALEMKEMDYLSEPSISSPFSLLL